tara:strand:- start:5730 stop:12401 length:6672 start_codon:yes stop_codon:yes gene_type:complete
MSISNCNCGDCRGRGACCIKYIEGGFNDEAYFKITQTLDSNTSWFLDTATNNADEVALEGKSGLPPVLFDNMSQGITDVQIDVEKNVNSDLRTIRIRFASNDDRAQFQTNLNSNYPDEMFALNVKVNELFTDSVEPTHAFYRLTDGDNNKIVTNTNVGDVLTFMWRVSDIATTTFNTRNISLNVNTNSDAVPLIASSAPFTHRGCVNASNTECRNLQTCTFGKDPDIAFYLAGVPTGTASDDFITRETQGGCVPDPQGNCTSFPCSLQRCCGPSSVAWCVDNAEFLEPDGNCCCCKYLANLADTSNCADTCNYGCACNCCEGIGGQADDCSGDQVCDDIVVGCLNGPGLDVTCDDNFPTTCNCTCQGQACRPGRPFCVDGFYDIPGCAFCQDRADETDNYICVQASAEWCLAQNNLLNVEWSCFNGAKECVNPDAPDGGNSVCPCLDDIASPVTTGICGCAVDADGTFVPSCSGVAGACLANWADGTQSDCTSNQNFSVQFTNSDNEISDQLILETKVPYYNQIKPTACGCEGSCSEAATTPRIGHLDPCFSYGPDDSDLSCCPNWCDGICPVYNNITFKRINHCNITSNVFSCSNCSGDTPPTHMEGSLLKLTLDFNATSGIELQRTKNWNSYVANTPDNSTVIVTENNDYTVPSDAISLEWNNVLGINGSLFDSNQALIPSLVFKTTTDRNLVMNDFSNLSSDWKMQSYCYWDLRESSYPDWPWGGDQENPALADARDVYSLIEGLTWAHNGNHSIQSGKQLWMRVYTPNLRGLYKTPVAFNNCDGSASQYKYQIDHVYSGNSQYERGYTNTDCITKDGLDCTSDNTCKYGNPWETINDVLNQVAGGLNNTSYIDAGGSHIDPSPGDFQFPIKPHTHMFELWFVGEAVSGCEQNANNDYTPEFKLAAIVREVADCSSINIDRLNDNENQYRLYNDTCGSYYWQCKERSTKLSVYTLTDDGSNEPWNQALNTSYVNDEEETIYTDPAINGRSAPRKITLTPKSSGIFRTGTGDDVQDSVTTLTPTSSVAWNEDLWYHSDPKHSFDSVGKSIPQVAARWTELPFRNYAKDFLDESKTLKGFYLTVSAFHSDGIASVAYYLDGAKSGLGTANVVSPSEHPLEDTKAQIAKNDSGDLLTGLEEYTVAVNTTSLSTGVHEVRAKINPNVHRYGGTRGTARYLYGEPPTGDASVNTSDLTNVLKGSTSYQVISGQDFPFSKAQWPNDIPDGPPINNQETLSNFSNRMLGVDTSENNLNPMWGASNFWNLHNEGFNYYADGSDASSKTQTKYNSNNFIFSGTPQQELLLNGYESFWFNFNPTPLTVYVGQAGDSVPEDSSYFATSLYEAFQWLESNYTADNASLHDAEIVLIPGTSASPRKYSWPNAFSNESLPASVSWCQNALQKKSFVIRSKNPDDKDATILWFPPSLDRVEMPWNNFALHVRDLTVFTSTQRGETGKTCLHSSGTNCRLLVENVIFSSACSTGIKASALVDGSGNVICGDTLQRAANGSVTGQLDYSKCRNINTTTSNLECAKTTADCASITCCGAKSTAGCQECTGANCTTCRNNCTCRSTEIDWWPYFCSDNFDISTNGTNLTPVILCGNNDCTSDDSWACKGIFGNDIVTSSSFMCLGTQPQHCVVLGAFNHELMDMADADQWKLGMYGKDIEVNNVPGTSLKNPVLMKHILVDNYNKTLISDKGHGCIIDLWIKNADPLTTSMVPNMDIVEWENIGYDTYSLEAAKDYDLKFGSPNPRSVRNFNCFIENRMMINIKVDNSHARLLNIKGPGLKYRDFLANPNASISTHSGHHNNFGMASTRNFVFKDFHIEEKKESDQVFGTFPINHLYIDNFVISNCLDRDCDSTAEATDTCSYAGSGSLFPLISMNLETGYHTCLHYGKKPIQNLVLTNSLFQNLGTGKYARNKEGLKFYNVLNEQAVFQTAIDWGPFKRKAGNRYNIVKPDGTTQRFFWYGAFEPVITNVRQQRTDREDSTLLAEGATTGPVVHKRVSPPLGRTACNSGCDVNLTNHNQYSIDSTSIDWLVNSSQATSKQLAMFGMDATSKRITSKKPAYASTLITGLSGKTADGTVLSALAGGTDQLQYPSEAHSNFIAYAESLSSGNLFDRGIPNVGGITLQWGNPKNYYHDVCTFNSIAETCKRNPILDGRNTTQPLTVVTESSGTYSWSTNTLAECVGKCKIVRDHYFVDKTDADNRIDLDWIPIIDECRCSDV